MGFSDQIFWYVARSSGIVSWFSAAFAVLAGLLISTRLMGRRPTIPYLLDIHRFLSAMAMVFLGIHMGALWADDFVSFGLGELLVPGVAEIRGYSPFGLALGVMAAWVMAVVQTTSLLKKWIPENWWHAVHFNSYLVLLLGGWHGVVAGSDADNRIMVGVAVSLLTAVVLVTVTRFFRAVKSRQANLDRGLGAEAPDPVQMMAGRRFG